MSRTDSGPITWRISARMQCLKLGGKIYRKAFYMLFLCTTLVVRMPESIFQPGLKYELGAKISCPVSQTGLKLSSCNHKRLFKKICSGGRAKLTVLLNGLNFAM